MRYFLPERPLETTGPRALWDLVFSIGLLCAILLIAGGLGVKILDFSRINPSSYLEKIVFAVPIGLGLFAYGIFALGLLGLVQAQTFLLWFAIAFFWTYQEWGQLASTGVSKLKGALLSFARLRVEMRLLVLAIALIFFLTLIQVVTPASDYDALMYHLQGPRLFLESGKIFPLPDLWQANGPFTIEMLFMFGLRFGSDTFAKLLHMSYAILLVLATFVFGRRFLGKEGGWIAAILLVGMPIFPIWSALANADMAWALYEFLGIYTLFLWIKSQKREWLVMSGIMTGLSLGCKYLALGNAVLIGLTVIWFSRKGGGKKIIQNAALFGGIAFIVGSPWYIKNWLWTGNPVYPLVAGGIAWPTERVQLLMTFLTSFGTGHRFLDYLLLPWNIYTQNHLFSTSGAPIEYPSILFALLIFYPFVKHKKIIHLLAGLVLIRFGIWAVGSRQIRFLLPILPVLCLLVASTLSGLERRFLGERGGYILKMGLLGGVTIVTLFVSFLYFSTKPLGVIIGKESKVNYLYRFVDHFPATDFIRNNLLPEESALLMWEGRTYYCDERCLPDAERGRWTILAMTSNYDIPTVATRLREERITHLLFIEGRTNFTDHNDPTGENIKAASFFREKFRDACTELVYSDPVSSLYKITCQGFK